MTPQEQIPNDEHINKYLKKIQTEMQTEIIRRKAFMDMVLGVFFCIIGVLIVRATHSSISNAGSVNSFNLPTAMYILGWNVIFISGFKLLAGFIKLKSTFKSTNRSAKPNVTMDGTHFLLESERRTALSAIARVVITVMTLLLLIPSLLIAILLTILINLVPDGAYRAILAPVGGIWRALLWALLKSSKIWEEKPLLRLPLLIIGLPLAIISYAFVACLPPLPNSQAKNSRLALCDQWPLTWSMWRQLDNQAFAKSRISSFLPDFIPPRW